MPWRNYGKCREYQARRSMATAQSSLKQRYSVGQGSRGDVEHLERGSLELFHLGCMNENFYHSLK